MSKWTVAFIVAVFVVSTLAQAATIVPLKTLTDGIGPSDQSLYGFRLTDMGDFDGDGQYDIAVSAPTDHNGGTNAGAVFIFRGPLGKGSDLNASNADTILWGQLDEYFGFSLDSGDFNGDGLSDLIIGAPAWASDTGRAYIFLGGNSTNRTSREANATFTGQWQGQAYGYSVVNIGNLNGDRFDDFAIGAGGGNQVFVFTGREHLQTEVVVLPEVPADYPNPVDFSNGINSSANTYGLGGASDGWDWAPGIYGGTHPDVIFPPVDSANPYGRTFIGLTSTNNGASVGPAGSGGYGVDFEVTESMVQAMNDGAELHLRFTWTTVDSPDASPTAGSGFESWEGEVYWVKASIWNSTTNRKYLGWNLDGDNNAANDEDLDATTDATNDLFYMNTASGSTNPVTTTQSPDLVINDIVDSAQTYYLDMGGKLSEWSTMTEALEVRIDDVYLWTQIPPIADLEGAEYPSGYGTVLAGDLDMNGDGFDDLVVGAPQVSETHIYFGSPNFGRDFQLYGVLATPERRDQNDTTDELNTQDLKYDDGRQWPPDQGFYVADRGQIIWINNWDIGNAKGDIIFAYLYLEYKTDGAYNGNNWVRWALDGGNLKQTDLRPVQTWGQQVNNWDDANGPYNLHTNGLTTLQELESLDLEFTNNAGGGGGGGKAVFFDYAWIYVASQMASNITIKGKPNSEFGASVAGLRSINGDPYDDLIIGAPSENNDQGAAYIYTGGKNPKASMSSGDAFASFTGANADGRLGLSVGSAGLFSFDQFPDIAIGAPAMGTLYIVRGGTRIESGVISDVAQYQMSGEGLASWFSYDIEPIGDINFNYCEELLVGSPAFTGTVGTERGKVYIIYNSDEDLFKEPFLVDWYPKGNQTINEGEAITFGVVVKTLSEFTVSYMWYLDDDAVLSGSPEFTYRSDFLSAGKHRVVVDASDGHHKPARVTWYVDVNNVNAPPRVEFYPAFDPRIDEGETIRFWADAYDPDADPLTFTWFLDGAKTAETGSAYLLRSDYSVAGEHAIILNISDGQFFVDHRWYLTIDDINRPPVIDSALPLKDPTVIEGAAQVFNITAHDPDGDPLTVVWSVDGDAMALGTNEFEVKTGFGDIGTKTVTVKVSDGEFTAERNWVLSVVAGNRPPIIDWVKPQSPVTMDEGTDLVFWVSAHDPDGDEIRTEWMLDGIRVLGDQSYDFRPPASPKGQYTLTTTVTDGKLNVSYAWTIKVNRKPTITEQRPTSGKSLISGERVELSIKAKDADKDPITVTWYINDKAAKTEVIPSSETGGASSLLFASPFGELNDITIKVRVSDGRLTSETGWKFNITTVSNTAPNAVIKYGPKVPKKGKAVSFDGASSFDPEGDIISYEWRFSDGTTATGRYVNKTYDQKGSFTATLTVTDSKGNSDTSTEVLSFGGTRISQGAESPLSMILFIVLMVVLVVLLLYQANRKGWIGRKKGGQDTDDDRDISSRTARIDEQSSDTEDRRGSHREPEDGPAIEGGFEELPVEEQEDG